MDRNGQDRNGQDRNVDNMDDKQKKERTEAKTQEESERSYIIQDVIKEKRKKKKKVKKQENGTYISRTLTDRFIEFSRRPVKYSLFPGVCKVEIIRCDIGTVRHHGI